MTEQWKQVKDFPDYSISNLGNVFSHKKDKLVSPLSGRGCNYQLWQTSTKRFLRSRNTLMREHWKWEWIKELDDDEECTEIKNQPGYFITNKGRVWSMNKWKFLSPYKVTDRDYYYKVNSVTGYLHTLVGRHFISHYQDGLEVCHYEENLSLPEINYVTNLWVGTHQQNSDDMVAKGRSKTCGVRQ